MDDQTYTIVGITAGELSKTSRSTVEEVQGAVSQAWRDSIARAREIRETGAAIAHEDMAALARFAIKEAAGEDYAIVLFLNGAARRECERAGVNLNILGEIQSHAIAAGARVLVNLPLYRAST